MGNRRILLRLQGVGLMRKRDVYWTGAALAAVLSGGTHGSLVWAIAHGAGSWGYVIYWMATR